MVIYNSAAIFIESSASLCDKIEKIDLVIAALETTALNSAANDHITEYQLDDGQTKIKTIYKGTDQILKSIDAFEKMKTRYINKLNGHSFRMVDSKSLRSRRKNF